jgi:radical SAM protein with 4Fe4S-binding SPASM domain
MQGFFIIVYYHVKYTMTLDQSVAELRNKFNVVGTIDFRENLRPNLTKIFLALKSLHKDFYQSNERIVIVMSGDIYNASPAGLILQSIQSMINEIDISNYFIELVTTNPNINKEYAWVLETLSIDSVPINISCCEGLYNILPELENEIKFTKFTKYQSLNSTAEHLQNLPNKHINLLSVSPVFCMAPWTQLMISPDSTVKPCCHSNLLLGDVSKQSLKEIWNSSQLRQLRSNMLAGRPSPTCESCYVQENLGVDSARQSYNRSLSNRIYKTDQTEPDGHVEKFELHYVDTRFNNLCNLACRSCWHTYSSSWHEIEVEFNLKNKKSPAILVAGKSPTDVFDQLMQHIDTLDKIYFAGGEPLVNQQMWAILDELDRRGRYEVELAYNTNFTKTRYRGRSIFSLWSKFKTVSIGASLDGEHARGEYLRSGTCWNEIIKNRQDMIKECPGVNFYISSTVSIINALHLPDFHRSWVNNGLIKAEDYSIQLLFKPTYMRVDRAPAELKKQIYKKYQEHLEWLAPLDPLGRAASGFNSVLQYLDSTSKFNAEEFWFEVTRLDRFHNTNLLNDFPELQMLKIN